MRKQASETRSQQAGWEELNPDLRSGQTAGRAPARGVGGPFPPRGLGLAERVQLATREGQGRPAHAGRGSGPLPPASCGRS